jgi:hypothetical protein
MAVYAAKERRRDQMNRYSIEEFVEKTEQQDKGQGLFELETERLLEINLNGQIWAKSGAMVSYRGQIKYLSMGSARCSKKRLLERAPL